ncbi:hypothetical protein G9C98_004956 [Cotesia typhae]|uniref:Fanconi anemia group M protein n=1 Tax=Cotesia typhae TaxID=2053667 RepID=A0A8J5R987_9HYME|nr:hypothetical protein G9C98_004956 [Cotesia typhae]
MDLLSQEPLFSTDPNTVGFDKSAGKKWIYPENYPVREYQFSIVKTALFQNTLVCLPTGLGKTFIAAVVMYNFWRWYPRGIIVFLAPTKPLVAQQIEACHDIMGIPISQTIQLTGVIHQKERKIAWQERRVIFATPQTFQYDLAKDIIPKELVKCVIIDEAHRALGKHAYCECVRLLNEKNEYYRLVALSATPGSKLEAVQEVIRNLHISRLELRDDSSPDILPYINQKNMQIVEVGMNDDFKRFYDRYMNIMDPVYRVLLKNNIIKMDISSLSKGKMFYIRNDLQKNRNKRFNYGELYNTINILSTMVYAKDLMIYHGLRTFHKFYQNHSDKPWINDKPELQDLLEEVGHYLGEFPNIQALMDGNDKAFADMNIVYGHRKYERLQEILTEYFTDAQKNNVSTRVIVFSEFRESVSEIYVSLYKLQPLIRPQIFVGQAHLMKQAQQKRAIEDFRNNKVNVLISTSVGEEGLDVGEVDLIVCFDTTGKTPTRLVQRIGRTGRKRDGRVIVLVTDSKEHQTLKSALISKDNLNTKVLQSKQIKEVLNDNSPRMIPDDLNPECCRMKMTVIPITPRARSKKKSSDAKKNKTQLKRKYTKKKLKDSFEDEVKMNIDGYESISTVNKPRTKKEKQSSLMNFFQNSNISNCRDSSVQDDEVVCMRVEEVPRIVPTVISKLNTNAIRIKPTDAKILSSDLEASNFLTLCAMKESEKVLKKQTTVLNFTFMPNFMDCEDDILENLKIPSLRTLDCILSLTEYIQPAEEKGDEFSDFFNDDMGNWDNDFVDYNQDQDSQADYKYGNRSNYQNKNDSSKQNELFLQKSKFEALLDDSTDEEDLYGPDEVLPAHERINLTDFLDVTNKNEQSSKEGTLNKSSVVTGGAFEDLLDTSSDESVEIIENPKKCENDLNSTRQATNVLIDARESHVVPAINNYEADTVLIDQIKTGTIPISDFENDPRVVDLEPELQIINKIINNVEPDTVLVNNLKPVTERVNNLDRDTVRVNNSEADTVLVNNLETDTLPVTDSDTLIISKSNPTQPTKSQNTNNIEILIQVPVQDNFDNIDFDSDFGSWEKKVFQKNIKSQDKNIKISPVKKPENVLNGVKSSNLVKNSQNSVDNIKKPTMNKLIKMSNEEKSENKKDDCHSPDLVKSSSHHRSNQSKFNRTLDFSNKKSLEVVGESYEKIHCTTLSDDDIFDCESLVADSDLEEQLRDVEKLNSDKKSENTGKDSESKVNQLKELDNLKNTLPLSCSSPMQLKKNDRNLLLEPITVDTNLIETYVNDCDWDSDFETSSAPITECKYFGSNPSTISATTATTSKQLTSIADKICSQKNQKENNPNWLSTKTAERKTIQQGNSFKSNKSQKNCLPILTFNPKHRTQKDSSDSDSDFAPTKIVKNVFQSRLSVGNGRTHDSPPKNNAKADSCLPKVNSPKSLSTSNLNKFAATSRVVSKLSSSKPGVQSTSSWIETKKSTSLDSFPKKQKLREHHRKKRRRKNNFIDDEADVSSDENHSSEYSEDDDDGADLQDFVSYTQYHDKAVDMKAHYLQSVRSPRRPGKFIIKQPKPVSPEVQIYSQVIPEEPNSYLYDSFCVEDGDEGLNELSSEEITVIEEVEFNRNKSRNRKRKRDVSEDTRSKRKRIIINSDSSGDDIEILRAQIADESMLLKNNMS